MSMSTTQEFDLSGALPDRGWHLLEASAGTGKTYSLTALVARFVAERDLAPEQLLMVTFTRAAASEMKHEVRQQLLHVLDGLEAIDDTGLDPWLAEMRACDASELGERIERVRAAISTIDAATITTIHGFFQQALADLGIRAGDVGVGATPGSDTEVAARVVRDALISAFAADASALGRSPRRTPEKIEDELLGSLRALSSSAGSSIDPRADTGTYGAEVAALVGMLREVVRSARAELGVLDFDDIIERVISLLDDAGLGEAIAATLRSRYRLVLIDEFQDTDTEQWKLFTKVFDPDVAGDDFLALIAVGDPKQAIYRFRGADIAAYLDAAADPRMQRTRLGDNHRTDRPLVEALNRWLGDVWFGSEAISYQQVGTPARNAESRLTDGGAPLQFRHLREKSGRKTNAMRRAIAIDVVDHIDSLVGTATIRERVGAVDEERLVRFRDICVLVRGHDDAIPVMAELRKRGIPAVQSRIGSVLDSDAVLQLRILLSALAMPGDARRARALELTWFAARPEVDPSLSPEQQDRLREVRTEALQNWSRGQADELLDRGVVGWFQALRVHPEVVDGIATGPDALRRLTDLEHLVELVESRLAGRRAPAGVVLRTLDELVRADDGDADEQKRRIDTDHDVVQITSMHSAKGLEYPIVLIPYAKDIRPSKRSIYIDGAVRYVDVAPDDPWTLDGLDQATRKARDGVEVIGDELRLLYVALTRAKHQLVLWWGCPESSQAKGVFKGSTARVLFGDTHDLTSETPKLDDVAVSARLRGLADELGDAVEYRELTRWFDDREFDSEADDLGVIEAASFPDRRVEREHWYRWSYTSIANGVRGDNEADAHGGGDEHHAAAVSKVGGPTFTGSLVGLPASNTFGTAVHDLMEHIDFAAADLPAEVTAIVERSGMTEAFDLDPDRLIAGLVDVIDTPLDPLPIALRDVARSDRLAEMEFHFPLGADAAVSLHSLFEVAAAHGGPFAQYFADLAEGQRQLKVRGLLTGSIDAVLRLDGGESFTVVDYKTNRLHARNDDVFEAPISTYDDAAMIRAMEHGDYPMQMLVYGVALHRLLSTRLIDYDIDRHVGPTLYLFVRGMVGADTPSNDGVRNGVFAWRPASELIVAASRLLGGRS